MPIPGIGAAYTASKAAMEMMTRILAQELRGTQITANCVAPGAVATDMFFAGRSKASVEAVAKSNPFERLGKVEDVAPVVAFLASDQGEWVNGQVIGVNGGRV
jgi:3-oxoacyl-[acyl-carrier protein] reductase